MDEREIRFEVSERGLAIDDGNVIGGPFIPDGIVRIYDRSTYYVAGSGHDLRSAYENLLFNEG